MKAIYKTKYKCFLKLEKKCNGKIMPMLGKGENYRAINLSSHSSEILGKNKMK